MASTNIEVEMRDNHLRSAEFFDFEKYTKMTCKSTSIKKFGKEKGKYKQMGNLTPHGITKPVIINMWYKGTITNSQLKAITSGCQFSGILKRSDFDIGSKFPALMISYEIKIKADSEFIKQ